MSVIGELIQGRETEQGGEEAAGMMPAPRIELRLPNLESFS
jgi:hypothetical protein